MARTGRPRKGQGEAGTAQTRIKDDLQQMVSDLLLVMDTTSAQLLDPMIRPDLTRMWEKHKPQIQRVKAALDAAEAAQRKAIEETRELERKASEAPTTPPPRRPRPES